MSGGKFSETLSRVENALFDLHHGTLEQITSRADAGSLSYVSKLLEVLLILDKATIYYGKDNDGNRVKIYRIVESDYSPDSED